MPRKMGCEEKLKYYFEMRTHGHALKAVVDNQR